MFVGDHPGRRSLEYIGGVDISFVKGDAINACAAFVVIKLPNMEVVYEVHKCLLLGGSCLLWDEGVGKFTGCRSECIFLTFISLQL